MNHLFSQELIERTIEYFHEKHAHEISPEIAEEYLHDMAGLYESFIEFAQNDSQKRRNE